MTLENLIEKKASDSLVEVRGFVSKTLEDKVIKGSPHQRFVVADNKGLTILATLNLDKANKLSVEEGDEVSLSGIYVFDYRGGYVHHLFSDQQGKGFVRLEKKKATTYPRIYAVHQLFLSHQTNRYIETEGRVFKLLHQDNEGTPHEKFIIKNDFTQTIMIIVNLDHDPFIPVEVGDHVEIAGIYVYNDYGGLIHITHHDHLGDRPSGWIYVSRLGKMFE